MLEEIINDKIDIFLICKTKLDSSLPVNIYDERLKHTFKIRQKSKREKFIALRTCRHTM